jgi:hypothetical protein
VVILPEECAIFLFHTNRDTTGAVDLPAIPRFSADPVRAFDAERKLLENIAGKFDETAQGVLQVVSERFPCPSCRGVAEQFSKAFPGIELELLPRGLTTGEVIAGGLGGQAVKQGATYFNNSLDTGGAGTQTMQGLSPR